MIYQLVFACGEPGCHEVATSIYEAEPGETDEQLRERDPLVADVLCDAGHRRDYRASGVREIRLVPDITPLV